MPNNINTIQYDNKSFRFSPHTEHSHVHGTNVMLYDDASKPDRQSNALKLDNKFKATALGISSSAILFVSMSGPQQNPDINFSVGEENISVNAYEYLSGYGEYLDNAPQELKEQFEQNPYVFEQYERDWSIEFFREKLADLVEGPDEFFFELYGGLDNAMGDIGRMLVSGVSGCVEADHEGYDL
ncbi:MAG: hypothetical protein ACRBCK_01300 [Alphaproteobacteria bacterium]